MPLSREASQVAQDIQEAADIYRQRGISGALDPIGLTIQIAALIGEERRGSKQVSSKYNGLDPVSEARKHPKVPFAPAREVAAIAPKRSHRKKEVRTPVAPKVAPPAKKPSRSRRR
jgi:hypothetical protein